MESVEDAQRDYIHKDEVRGFSIGMGNGRNTDNGHKEGKEESMNLVETIKIL